MKTREEWVAYFEAAKASGVPETTSLSQYMKTNDPGVSARTGYTKAREVGFADLIGESIIPRPPKEEGNETVDPGTEEIGASGAAGDQIEVEPATEEGTPTGVDPEVETVDPEVEEEDPSDVDTTEDRQPAASAGEPTPAKKSDGPPEPDATDRASINYAPYLLWAVGGLVLIGGVLMMIRAIKKRPAPSSPEPDESKGGYAVEPQSPYGHIKPFYED